MIGEEEEIQIKCSLLFNWGKGAEWSKTPPVLEKLNMGSKEGKVRNLTPKSRVNFLTWASSYG